MPMTGFGPQVTNAKARIYLSADQDNINSGVFTHILVDTIDYDPSGLYAANGIKIKVPGYYVVFGATRWEGGTVVADKRWIGSIRVNNVERTADTRHSSMTEAVICAPLDIMHLDVDDVVELFCWQGSGVDTPDIDGALKWTYLGVHLLSLA